ncbi:hypothetical protein PDESU_03033 [Pontiella desulfatans]|uniref:Lipoprotein n=1 Tax=Pontiella desulfatans TaxID=2750659 RepID=A0A6C2U4K6_PONDE|nr:hypothetical protein [Pontiella desulfatans]VGO14471.1 hypothetical protein PDESU_03033 [Pontiella desulfatans]
MNIKSIYLALPLLAVCMSACISAEKAGAETPSVPHEIQASHPALAEGKPTPQTLIQTRDPEGSLLEYYLDVDSVICGDGQCEIISVRLFWDPIGTFLRYEFPKGGDLTKRGHQKFSAKDHEKLQGILSDPASLLKEVNPKDVVSPAQAQTGDEIDGSSGATLLSDKSAIVSGAVYTCYTLWHWVNSPLQATISGISAKEMNNRQLIDYLNSTDEQRIEFAITRLSERGTKDESTKGAVYNQALNGNTGLASAAIGYFESLGAENYYEAIAKLFSQGSSKKQVLYLSSLVSTDLPAPDGFYDHLSNSLPELESYYEVHLLLNLMTDKNRESPEVVANVLVLLDNKSFLIGRRAYNFLKDLELPEPQLAQVEAFRTKYADRL